MSDSGWIRLDRKILNNWVWADKPFSEGQAWIYFLLRANHDCVKVPVGSDFITLEPGDFMTSEVKLAEAFGWSRTKIRRFISRLESDHMCVKKAASKGTVISVVNWALYQNPQTAKEQKKNSRRYSRRTAKEQQKNTDNNINNITIKQKNNVNTAKADAFAVTQQQLQPLPDALIGDIIRIWNSQNCTQNIQRIYADRLDNVRTCIGDDLNRFMGVIGSLDDQAFLSQMGRAITFDWATDPGNFEKIADGNYRDSYSRGGGIGGLKRDW